SIIIQRQPIEPADHPEAGVGHHHVDAAQLGAHARHRRFEIAVAGHIAGERERALAVLAELACQRLQTCDAPGRQGDAGPTGGELTGTRRPDASRRTRDEHHLPVKCSHGSPQARSWPLAPSRKLGPSSPSCSTLRATPATYAFGMMTGSPATTSPLSRMALKNSYPSKCASAARGNSTRKGREANSCFSRSSK